MGSRSASWSLADARRPSRSYCCRQAPARRHRFVLAVRTLPQLPAARAAEEPQPLLAALELAAVAVAPLRLAPAVASAPETTRANFQPARPASRRLPDA